VSFRRGDRHTFTAVSTAWSTLLNVPRQDAEGGYVAVRAKDALVQVLARVTVDREVAEQVYLVGPGEPAAIPVGEDGVDLSYRPVQLCTYSHDEAGTPSSSAPAEYAVVATYRARMPLPPPRPPRLVVDQRDVLGQLWTGSDLDVALPAGPPGLWRLNRVVIWRVSAGSDPNVTQFTAVAAATSRAYDLGVLDYNSTARAVASNMQAPLGASNPYGGDADRIDYSRDGWVMSRLVLDTTPANDELYRIRQSWTFHGLALPADQLSTVLVS